MTSDGVRLYYLERGHGLPLVLLPGWTQPASGFSAQVTELSDSFRCLALDFRGHGESDRSTHGYRVSRLARDCLDLLDHLGLEEAILLGHSGGCVVIWSFVDLFRLDRVHSLVLCDETIAFVKRPEWSEPDCRRYGAFVDGQEALALAAAVVGPDVEQVLRDFLADEFSADFPRSEIARAIEGSLKMPRAAAAGLMLSFMHADFRDLLPRIGRPTLCVGGTHSHLGPEVMPWIVSQLPARQLAMIEARHFVHLENPGAFNAAVRDFVESRNCAPPSGC